MAVREFELFHGVVLTKLTRSKRPITLRMIETKPSEAWSTYIINDEVLLVIKHSTNQRRLERTRSGLSWTFVFSPEQLRQLQPSDSHKQVFAALVGGGKDVKKDTMQVCLLDWEEIQKILDLRSSKSVSLTVRYLPGKALRVFHERKQELLVPQNRVDKWEIPGG